MQQPIVCLKEFSYIYPQSEKLALDNITIDIAQGSFVGIIGPNRAGKSTLVSSLSGLTPFVLGGQYNGSFCVKGEEITDDNAENVTKTVGVVLQDAESQFSQESVEDEIAFGMCNLGVPYEEMKARMGVVAKSCNLEAFMDRSPLQLSGGQQQRVAVACMLALRPEVIILDETTSQLDPIGRDEVFKIAKDLHTQGYTIIMVDHNIEKLAQYSSHLAVVHEGKLVMYDETATVLQQKETLDVAGIRMPQVTQAASCLYPQLQGQWPINLEQAVAFFNQQKGGTQ